MRIAVVDGQGGGIGKAVVEKLREAFGNNIDILALGTNAMAASVMMKAGANECASGENAVVVNSAKVDFIVGSVAVIAADAMLGELTPLMARAIAGSDAKKVLIPLNKCGILVAGINSLPLPHYINDVIELIKKETGDVDNV